MDSFNPSADNAQSNIVPFNSGRATSSKWATLDANQSFWSRVGEMVFRLLLPSSEPRIVHKQEPNGNEYYQVYDPVSGNSKTFGSELETRIWLDRRFYE